MSVKQNSNSNGSERSQSDGRVNVAVDKGIHAETVLIQTMLKQQHPDEPRFRTVRTYCDAALKEANRKHRRRASAAASVHLDCSSSRKHTNTKTQQQATAQSSEQSS